MKKILLSLLVLIPLFTFGATPALQVFQGGTGTSTVPTLGQVLTGQSNGTYAPQLPSATTPSVGSDGYLQFASSTAGFFNATSSLFWNNTLGKLEISLASTTATTSRLSVKGDGTNPILNLFSGAGTNLLTVLNSGNVGIGNVAPEVKLEVGDTKAGQEMILATNEDTGTSSYAEVQAKNGVTPNANGMRMMIMGSGFTTAGGFVQNGGVLNADVNLAGGLSIMTRANAPIRFYTNGHTSERMRINNDGNVGIGTINPTSKLSIIDSSNSIAGQQIRIGNGVGTSDYTFGRNPSNGFLDFAGSQTGYIGYTFSGGSVGIGTSTPASKLDIYGTAGSANIFTVSSSTNARLFTIGASGSVGIGVTSPSAKLHLIGTTEQFRSGYDATNYWNTTTVSGGITTFNAIGATTPAFVFSKPTTFSATTTISGGSTHTNTLVCYLANGDLGYMSTTTAVTTGICSSN